MYGPVYNSEPGAIKQVWLLPADFDKAYQRPAKTLPRPVSHQLDWADAAKAGKQTSGNFQYGGLVTQICLLGNVAIRLKGQKLLFDAKTEKFTNSSAANAPLRTHPTPRLGVANLSRANLRTMTNGAKYQYLQSALTHQQLIQRRTTGALP